MSKRRTNRSPPSCPSKISKRGPLQRKAREAKEEKEKRTLFSLAQARMSLNSGPYFTSTFSTLGDEAVPPFPGATKTFSTKADWASFHERACSRPPAPSKRILWSLRGRTKGIVRTRSSRRDRRWAEIREPLGSSPVDPARKGNSKPKVSYECSCDYISPHTDLRGSGDDMSQGGGGGGVGCRARLFRFLARRSDSSAAASQTKKSHAKKNSQISGGDRQPQATLAASPSPPLQISSFDDGKAKILPRSPRPARSQGIRRR